MALRKLNDALAPRPSRRSYSRSLYDALTSLAGPAPVEQIIEMLPATDDADKWSKASPDKVVELLRSAEAHGYVKYQPNLDRWTIAHRKYFDERQAHIAEQRNRDSSRKLHKAATPPPQFIPFGDVTVTPTNKLCYAAGFFSGALSVLGLLGIYALVTLT